jgi:hypothetical protein
MKKSLITLIAGASFAIAGIAVAADKPVMLSANQMDTVTAGGTADASAAASAIGLIFGTTTTTTSVDTRAGVVFPTIPTEGGQISWILSTANASSASAAQ